MLGALPYPPPGELYNPGIELTSLTSPALPGRQAVRFFTTSATWEMEHSSIISTPLETGEETGEEGGDRTPPRDVRAGEPISVWSVTHQGHYASQRVLFSN